MFKRSAIFSASATLVLLATGEIFQAVIACFRQCEAFERRWRKVFAKLQKNTIWLMT